MKGSRILIALVLMLFTFVSYSAQSGDNPSSGFTEISLENPVAICQDVQAIMLQTVVGSALVQSNNESVTIFNSFDSFDSYGEHFEALCSMCRQVYLKPNTNNYNFNYNVTRATEATQTDIQTFTRHVLSQYRLT